jgi:hypothetical protein
MRYGHGFSIFFSWGAALCHGLTDITFFATSDVHFGQNSASKDSNRAAIVGHLNTLPGKAYPSSVGGGPVAAPKGVLIPGDLIDNSETSLWKSYVADYGIGGEGRLKFPVYDALGNHEFYGSTFNTIAAEHKKRNRLRAANPAFKITNIDTSGLHYSWDWDAVHFVNLNVFSGTRAPYVQGNPNAFGSLEFLKQDLEKSVGASGRPVFVMQHYPISGEYSWMTATDRASTVQILKKYNCIGILNGHTHAKAIFRYEGIDAYDDGSAMFGDQMVFRITDGKMFVVNRIGNAWGALVSQKNISMGTPVASRPGASREETWPGFSFSVQGLGRIYSGREFIRKVEVLNLAGKRVRSMRITHPEMAWDGREDTGGRATPGVYLIRMHGAQGPVAAVKVLIR